jgi:ubiquitin C-terminal hydrolase
VLGHVCRENVSLSLRIFSTLKEVHKSIPHINAFDVNYEAENKHRSGFVGLRNLGSTCYMNSLLQMLYMRPTIRSFLLNNDFASLDAGSGSPQPKEGLVSSVEMSTHIIHQLQKVFKYLHYSEKKFYTPLDFMRILNHEYNVQQDACEYFLILCEKFESCISELNQRIVNKSQSSSYTTSTSIQCNQIPDVFKLCFGGKICNQMFVATSSNADEINGLAESIEKYGIREHEEHFNVISLDVKHCADLCDSLSKFVKNEVINGYAWEDNMPRVDIIKRQCISQMSDTLIFHLKRFELNFDTFIREKVNDIFPFPVILDMFPYTKEGLTAKINEALTEPEACYVFELCGVIVHAGTSDSGHYFAYLKDASTFAESTPNNGWMEYNDAETYSFDVSQLASECFGGANISHDFNLNTKSMNKFEMENPKNAYMLVYQRQGFKAVEEFHFLNTISNSHKDNDLIYKQITKENSVHRLCIRTLNPHHFRFYTEIIQTIILKTQIDHSLISSELVPESIHLLFRYVARTLCVAQFKEMFEILYDYITKYDQQFVAAYIKERHEGSHVKEISGTNHRNADAPTIIIERIDVKSRNDGGIGAADLPRPSSPLQSGIMPPPPPSPATELQNVLQSSSDINASPISPIAETESTAAPDAVLDIKSRADTMNSLASPVILLRTDNILTVQSLSKSALCYLNNSFDDTVMACVIHSTNDEIRANAAISIKRIVETAWSVELQMSSEVGMLEVDITENSGNSGAFITLLMQYPGIIDVKMGALSCNGGNIDKTESTTNIDADLAWAIELSKEEESTKCAGINGLSGSVANGSVLLSNPFLLFCQSDVSRFIFELTMDSRLRYICELWRNNKAFCQLLSSIAMIDRYFRVLLIYRDVISQIVDMILGEQSPLNNKLYTNSNKKRAPSSYLNTYNNSNTNKSALKSIPDWTELLDLLFSLVQECYLPRDKASPNIDNCVITSEWDLLCITSKTLYSTLIKQTRYASQMIKLIEYISLDNNIFSMMICEVLCEELSVTSSENMHYIFDIIHQFLSIQDTLKMQRFCVLFGKSNNSAITVFESYATQGIKSFHVLIFIRSFIMLFTQHSEAFDSAICTPVYTVNSWAGWMAKFLMQHMISTGATKDTGNSVGGNSAKPNGPYVIVYGEDNNERLLTWNVRFEQTYNMLTSLLLTWDIDIVSVALDSSNRSSTGINMQRYHSAPVATTAYPISNGGSFSKSNANLPVGTIVQTTSVYDLADGMSDEELARLLQSEDLSKFADK